MEDLQRQPDQMLNKSGLTKIPKHIKDLRQNPKKPRVKTLANTENKKERLYKEIIFDFAWPLISKAVDLAGSRVSSGAWVLKKNKHMDL